MKTAAAEFQTIVKHAPLVSVDLILIDPDDHCLLGRRLNRPAMGTMFVPGGRVLKNETIDGAISRTLHAETGYRIGELDELTFKGVYEHFYDDSFWDATISTHYVVLAHRIKLKSRFMGKSDNQHDFLEWISSDDLLNRRDVHKNVKAYFN